MSYTPTTWVTGDVITATKLNNAETQYAEAIAYEPPSVKVKRTTDHTTTDATEAIIEFDTELWDNNVMHDTVSNKSQLKATTAGLYLIIGGIRWKDPLSTRQGERRIRIRANGTTHVAGQDTYVIDAQTTPYQSVVGTFSLAGGEYVELMITSFSGSAENVEANYAFFEMRRIGAQP